MSQSSTHALSTRLFVQAALTGLLAPTAAHGSTWLVLTLAVAAGAVAVALLLRNSPANAKQMVVGFEAVALAVGGLGLAGGHYIPGTIIGVVTLINALNTPVGAPAAAGGPWVPPADAGTPVVEPIGAPAFAPPPMAAPAMAAPMMAAPAMAAPMMTATATDNPYAPPAEALQPAWGPPAPISPPAPVAPPAPLAAEVAPTAALVPEQAPALAVPAPAVPQPPAQPLRPEDIPPASRSMTILPGR